MIIVNGSRILSLTPAYERYRTALAEYRAAKKVFNLARLELKSSRIEVLRASRKEFHKTHKKVDEAKGPET